MQPDGLLAISELAQRSGVAASAIRHYESMGLLASGRSEGNHRRYPREALRRVAFIRAAQAVGLTLEEIRAALGTLPGSRTPGAADWRRLAAGWKPLLDEKIRALTDLRDRLDSCIGCGCLSLKSCALYNAGDRAAKFGSGPRYLLGDKPAPGIAGATAPATRSPARSGLSSPACRRR